MIHHSFMVLMRFLLVLVGFIKNFNEQKTISAFKSDYGLKSRIN